MKTGVIAKDGREIEVGDIVHYRGSNLCAHGTVIEDNNYKFAIKDDRPKTKDRIYSLFNDGKYTIENR